jgi:hypothetical protein
LFSYHGSHGTGTCGCGEDKVVSERDFGPRASHPNFRPPALRVPIVLGCQSVTSADTKNKNSFSVLADLISRHKKYVLLYRLIKSADTKNNLFFVSATIINPYQK